MSKLMMRRGFAALAGALFSMGAVASTPDLGSISLSAGGKVLNKDDWSPAEDQFEGGARLAYQPANWPFGFTAAYFSSYGKGNFEGSEFRGRTHEIQLGLEKIWSVGDGSGRPYVGGGVVIGKAAASLEDVSDSDKAIGGWVGGGYTWVLARHLALGVDSRYSYTRVRLFDVNGEGGGFHIGGTIGYAW
ncbi:MAG: hypothetical protein JWR16_2328 [Nevskia sp.]|nr:hypothetical protein [Nevskia sp.]